MEYKLLKPVHVRNLPMVAQELDHTCGAACFESMFQLLFGVTQGEMFFAQELGALALGYTPIERILDLAKRYHLDASLLEGQTTTALIEHSQQDHILFVTWWFDDAGHYSLVRELDPSMGTVILMDPWQAREQMDTVMSLDEFAPLWSQRGAKILIVKTNALTQ